MSIVSVVFSRRTLKLIVALAIPAFFFWVFVYSQQQANIEVKKYKEEQTANPTTEKVTIKNYILKEVDDQNRIRWQLTASSGVAEPGNQQVALTGVRVVYFDGPVMKMCLTAPKGDANESTRNVTLIGNDKEPVSALGEEGKAKLEAKKVELTKKNQFIASGGVNIVWPEVAKVNGDLATGTAGVSNLEDLKIVGNTHAEILVK